MRILSQDGLHEGIIDVPYEQVSLEQRKNEIWCRYSSTMDNHCAGKLFAKYSTEARTRKAMELLHEKYLGMTIYPFSDKSSMVKPKVFRFPADNEIEV